MADRDDLISMVKAERARAEAAEAEARALREQLAAACDILDAHAEVCSRSGAYAVLKGHAARLRAATADPTPEPDHDCGWTCASPTCTAATADPTPEPSCQTCGDSGLIVGGEDGFHDAVCPDCATADPTPPPETDR